MCHIRTLSGMVVLCVGLFIGTTTPASAQEVPWRYDYTAARREAKEKNKPLIIDFGTVDCVWCKKLDTSTFRDPAVVKALTEQFIPVKIDATKDAALARALGIDSFPTLVFAAPNSKILGQQAGYVNAAEFSKQVARLLADAGKSAGPVVAANDANIQTSDKVKRARELLAKAKSDFAAQDDAACLERCRLLTAGYADQAEASEAERLAVRIKNDPERLAQACEKLTDSLGDTYLDLGESLLKNGQAQQALASFEKTIRICPGTRQAQIAQERLLQVREQIAQQQLGKPVIRGVSP